MGTYISTPVETYDSQGLKFGPIECEYGTYADGYDCEDSATFCIIDIDDKSDPTYPEGFHDGHLCDLHVQAVAHLYDFVYDDGTGHS